MLKSLWKVELRVLLRSRDWPHPSVYFLGWAKITYLSALSYYVKFLRLYSSLYKSLHTVLLCTLLQLWLRGTSGLPCNRNRQYCIPLVERADCNHSLFRSVMLTVRRAMRFKVNVWKRALFTHQTNMLLLLCFQWNLNLGHLECTCARTLFMKMTNIFTPVMIL